MCGLAQCWSLAAERTAVPVWTADGLWLVSGVLYLGVLGAYAANVVGSGRVRSEAADPTSGPFVSLMVIVPMLLGSALAPHHAVGRLVFFVSLALTVAFGSWLTGRWLRSGPALASWHPGYLLPTVAGGLVAAGVSASLGYDTLARLMFGYGIISWTVLGPVVVLRLVSQPPLPPALVPTLAVLVAPPVVAGNAWAQITGDRTDLVALVLAGYAAAMVAVQVSLVPVFAQVRFGPGWWAFSFSYAAVVLTAIRLVTAGPSPLDARWTYLLLAAATAGVAVILARSALALVAGTYLPTGPAPTLSSPSLLRELLTQDRLAKEP
jgi:tellurite resistance protein